MLFTCVCVHTATRPYSLLNDELNSVHLLTNAYTHVKEKKHGKTAHVYAVYVLYAFLHTYTPAHMSMPCQHTCLCADVNTDSPGKKGRHPMSTLMSARMSMHRQEAVNSTNSRRADGASPSCLQKCSYTRLHTRLYTQGMHLCIPMRMLTHMSTRISMHMSIHMSIRRLWARNRTGRKATTTRRATMAIITTRRTHRGLMVAHELNCRWPRRGLTVALE